VLRHLLKKTQAQNNLINHKLTIIEEPL